PHLPPPSFPTRRSSDLVSGILHGGKRHPSKFNPITFTMDTVRPTTFDMIITEVSGSGGATVNVTLDDELALGLDLADPDGLLDRSEEHTSELQSRGHLV